MTLKQQITQQELHKVLAHSAGVSEGAVVKVLGELARIATHETKFNGGFVLPGIGMIESVERFERTGINPMTAEKFKIGPSTKIRFSFESRFKSAVSRQ